MLRGSSANLGFPTRYLQVSLEVLPAFLIQQVRELLTKALCRILLEEAGSGVTTYMAGELRLVSGGVTQGFKRLSVLGKVSVRNVVLGAEPPCFSGFISGSSLVLPQFYFLIPR